MTAPNPPKSPARNVQACLKLLALMISSVMALAVVSADDREPQTIIDDTCLLALRSIDQQLKQGGFSLRADNWTGLLESSQPLIINTQLFRGHDYLFVLAADPHQSNRRPLTIQVADRAGKVLASASAEDGKPATLAFTPPNTGSFLLVLRLDPDNTDQDMPTTALSAFMMAYR